MKLNMKSDCEHGGFQPLVTERTFCIRILMPPSPCSERLDARACPGTHQQKPLSSFRPSIPSSKTGSFVFLFPLFFCLNTPRSSPLPGFQDGECEGRACAHARVESVDVCRERQLRENAALHIHTLHDPTHTPLSHIPHNAVPDSDPTKLSAVGAKKSAKGVGSVAAMASSAVVAWYWYFLRGKGEKREKREKRREEGRVRLDFPGGAALPASSSSRFTAPPRPLLKQAYLLGPAHADLLEPPLGHVLRVLKLAAALGLRGGGEREFCERKERPPAGESFGGCGDRQAPCIPATRALG